MSFSLSGIASGLDTSTIITQLMQLERIPYNKLESKQTSLNSQLSTLRSINTKLNTLRSAAEELLTKSNFSLRKLDVSDQNVLTATTSGSLPENTYQINVTQLATRHAVKSGEIKADDVASLTGSIVINDVTINIPTATEDEEPLTNSEMLNRLMADINSKDLGAKASIIETKPGYKTLVLTSDKSGAANSIQVASGVFGFTDIDGSGQNAKLNVNGIDIEASSNELNNVISGLNLTLKKTGETTVGISTDADKIAEKVDAFVKAYNDVITTIKSNTGKGKSLQGDATLRSLDTYLNGLFNKEVGTKAGEGEHQPLRYLFEIGLEIDRGITTSSAMNGTIKFDKDKFKAALAENPDEVYRLFALDDSSNNGIARQFRDSLRDWTRSGTGILAVKIEGFDSQISFVKKQMEAMESRLTMKEEQLKKQFAAMETALGSLQNQQAWMASQISSLSLY